MDLTENLGYSIRKIRKEKGLSQQQLAEKCGFSNTTLSSYENGKKIPSLVTLSTIAEKLQVSIDRIYYGDGNISFINSVSDVGRKTVNAIYYLWEQKVLGYNAYIRSQQINTLFADSGHVVYITNHLNPVLRLLKSLQEFSEKKDTYSDPEGYLEMILDSAANEINREIDYQKENNKKRKGNNTT